jgi:hypothetical protein
MTIRDQLHRISRAWWVVIGAVTGMMGTAVGVAEGWPLVEPYLIAHRGYVIYQIGEIRTPLNELTLWRLEDLRSRKEGEIASWTIQLQKENDPSTRVLMEERVQQLQQEKDSINTRIRSLRPRG